MFGTGICALDLKLGPCRSGKARTNSQGNEIQNCAGQKGQRAKNLNPRNIIECANAVWRHLGAVVRDAHP